MIGKLITLEGGEGAGKSTQARLLADWLCSLGLPVLRTREPGGAPGAELLRGILLDGNVSWSGRAEALLHFAARVEHVDKTVRPALSAGLWVVCDRFNDSTMAYQGYGSGVDRGWISSLIKLMELVPDLTFVLDIGSGASAERLIKRGQSADRYERLGDAFQMRVRDGFRAIAAAEPDRCCIIAAELPRNIVRLSLINAVRKRLQISEPM